MLPELERVLEPAYLEDLGDVGTDRVRSMRAECTDLENAVSYVRRLAQGRLDLLAAAATRRADGSGGSLADLVASLPDLLSDGVRAPASGRVSEDLDPPDELVDPLVTALDAVVSPATLSSMTDVDDEALAAALAATQQFEDELSGARRRLHVSIDSLNDELAKRIAAGEAPARGT